VNTDWQALGHSVQPGWHTKVQFEFLDQDQLRSGTDTVSHAEITEHHEEARTINRNWRGSLDYGINQDWGLRLTIPNVFNHSDALLSAILSPFPGVFSGTRGGILSGIFVGESFSGLGMLAGIIAGPFLSPAFRLSPLHVLPVLQQYRQHSAHWLSLGFLGGLGCMACL